MGSRVTVARIESIPSGVAVRHIDELSDEAKECLFQVVRKDVPMTVDSDVATEFAQCDVIKFTDYYRITITNSHASGHITA